MLKALYSSSRLVTLNFFYWRLPAYSELTKGGISQGQTGTQGVIGMLRYLEDLSLKNVRMMSRTVPEWIRLNPFVF